MPRENLHKGKKIYAIRTSKDFLYWKFSLSKIDIIRKNCLQQTIKKLEK